MPNESVSEAPASPADLFKNTLVQAFVEVLRAVVREELAKQPAPTSGFPDREAFDAAVKGAVLDAPWFDAAVASEAAAACERIVEDDKGVDALIDQLFDARRFQDCIRDEFNDLLRTTNFTIRVD